MPKLQEKPSARKREDPALQNVKFLNFFVLLPVIFSLLVPDKVKLKLYSVYMQHAETLFAVF
jgi:hypothetical protein